VRISRKGEPELRLTESQIDDMEAAALERNDDLAYLLVGLCARRSWRVSSVTGYEKTAKYTRTKNVERPSGAIVKVREKVVKDYALPGLRREDIGDDQVAVHMKGGKVEWQYVPEPYMTKLKEVAAMTHFGERLVPWTEDHANDVLVEIARAAGVPNPERIHIHRLRHYFGTHMARKIGRDPFKLKSLMGHTDIRATQKYVSELTPEEEKEILDSQ